MSFMDVTEIIAIAVGTGAVANVAYGYFRMLRERPTVEKSVLLRKQIITHYADVLRSLNIRDKAVRRIIINDDDALSFDKIQIAYETLLELDLSRERFAIDHEATKKTESEYIVQQIYSSLGKSASSPISAILNAGLLASYMRLILTSVNTTASTSSSIVGVMLGERIKIYNRSYLALFLALLISVASSVISGSGTLLSFGSIISIMMIGGLAANQKALAFRIKNGLYGSNSNEALELLRFIESHSDKSDFSSGDRAKRILPEQADHDANDRVVYGQGVTA